MPASALAPATTAAAAAGSASLSLSLPKSSARDDSMKHSSSSRNSTAFLAAIHAPLKRTPSRAPSGRRLRSRGEGCCDSAAQPIGAAQYCGARRPPTPDLGKSRLRRPSPAARAHLRGLSMVACCQTESAMGINCSTSTSHLPAYLQPSNPSV